MIGWVQLETVVQHFAHLFGFNFLFLVALVLEIGVEIGSEDCALELNVLHLNIMIIH